MGPRQGSSSKLATPRTSAGSTATHTLTRRLHKILEGGPGSSARGGALDDDVVEALNGQCPSPVLLISPSHPHFSVIGSHQTTSFTAQTTHQCGTVIKTWLRMCPDGMCPGGMLLHRVACSCFSRALVALRLLRADGIRFAFAGLSGFFDENTHKARHISYYNTVVSHTNI